MHLRHIMLHNHLCEGSCSSVPVKQEPSFVEMQCSRLLLISEDTDDKKRMLESGFMQSINLEFKYTVEAFFALR